MTRYVLSLDGGGVRGLSTLYFLKELDKYLRDRYDKGIYDTFSLYVGTSVGGMIAACLACKISPSHICEYVDSNIDSVFIRRGLSWPWSNRYSSKGLDDLIQGILPDIMIKDVNKPLLIPVYNTTLRRPELMSSRTDDSIPLHKAVGAGNLISLYKAVSGGSAAPTFFSPVYISDTYYIDGIMSTDPVMTCYSEGIDRWCNDRIKVLSIGTGICPEVKKNPGLEWGAIQWILKGRIVDILLGASGKLSRDHLNKLIGDDYLRINSRLERTISMDSKKELDLSYLKCLGARWCSDFEKDLDGFFLHL